MNDTVFSRIPPTRIFRRGRVPPARLLARAAVAAIVALQGAPAAQAADAGLAMSCGTFDAVAERQRIAAAGSGLVKRRTPERLEVRVAGKTLRFDNDDPQRDDADLVYAFCDRREGWLLLHRAKGLVFGGVLVDEATGAQLPAGEDVIFSNDRRAYFAAIQPDGLDGQEWEIHFADGRLSWKGFSFIQAAGSNDIHAELDQPHWSPAGQFVARARCVFDTTRQWSATLTRHGDQWGWAPIKSCPAEKDRR